MSDALDLINRDPNDINGHLKCQFEDVLAETEGAHSIDCVWKLSYTCFNCWKGLCYKIATLLCGICIAAGWGCDFAFIAFAHVWYLTPCLKVFQINCGLCKNMYNQCIGCCVEPCCMACGLLFHQLKK